MKKAGKKKNPWKRLLKRYRQLPRQLRSPRVSERSRAQRLLAVTICIPVILFCLGWIASYQIEKVVIERKNAEYQALYAFTTPSMPPELTATPSESASPAVTATPIPTEVQTPDATPSASASPSPTPESSPETTASPVPTPSPEIDIFPDARTSESVDPISTESIPSAEPSAAQSLPEFPVSPDRTYAPHGTANPDTAVYSLESPPPVQESFADLLALNPETIGYLTIPDQISLPVVQRKNDNAFYLNHSFDLSESSAGTLFLDGANLLVPEDQNLLVYGHNMKNGTMFHTLLRYSDIDFLKENALVYFDTIYEDRVYVPFAILTASMDPDSMYYLDIRQFALDETSHAFFVQNLQALSVYDIPVDVCYDDSILMLVTCEYIHNDGRFIVALRELREDETEVQMKELLRYSTAK